MLAMALGAATMCCILAIAEFIPTDHSPEKCAESVRAAIGSRESITQSGGKLWLDSNKQWTNVHSISTDVNGTPRNGNVLAVFYGMIVVNQKSISVLI